MGGELDPENQDYKNCLDDRSISEGILRRIKYPAGFAKLCRFPRIKKLA